MICTTVHEFKDNIKMWWEQQTGIHGAAKYVDVFFTFLVSKAINNNCTNTWQNVISLFCIYDQMAPRVIRPLHPNISIQILHTLLYIFLLVLTRRIYLKIKASCVGDHFLYSHDLNEWFSHITVRRN